MDYLSKYYANNGEGAASDGNENNAGRKKKKKKRKDHNKERSTQEKLFVAFHDEEEDAADGEIRGSKFSENEEDEEEEGGPLIVAGEEFGTMTGLQASRGEWVADETSAFQSSKDKNENFSGGNSDSDPSQSGRRKRRRYDSDDGASSSSSVVVTRGKNGQSLDDSDVDRRRRRRYDSDSDSDNGEDRRRGTPGRVKRSSESPGRSRSTSRSRSSGTEKIERSQSIRKERYDSDEGGSSREELSDDDREQMSSGHVAGLQQAQDFTKAEHKIQTRRRREAQAMVDEHGMGETVYRDAEGRRQVHDDATSTDPTGNQRRLQQQTFYLNQGKLQQQERENVLRERQQLQESSFARTTQDDDLERMKKNAMREGDPMADYQQGGSSQSFSDGKSTTKDIKNRPIYKGPPAPPNRYQIRPGYRWDAVHRGNGFEEKLLASQFGAQRKKEEAYRWSSADM